MARSLGVLTLDIVAKIGGYTAGLDKAEKEALKRAKAIEKAFDGAAVAVGVSFGLMATAGVAAFAAINRGIDNAAKFQDMSEEIGAAAEDIASFAVAAATAGVDMESLGSASIKLTKSLVGVDDESKAAGAALANLGINIGDFKKLDPASQYEAVGKALSGYADGANKTATAVALFGKAGAEQLKVFKALEEQGGRTKILTAEQIAQADAMRDAQAKLTAELSLYASAIATQFIGPTNELIKIAIAAAREILGLDGNMKTLASNDGVRRFAENSAVALAGFIEGIGDAVAAVGTLLRAAQSAGAGLRLTAEAAALATPGGLVRGVKNGFSDIKDAYDGNAKAYETLSKSFVSTVERTKTSESKKLEAVFAKDARDRNRRLLNDANYGAATDNRPQLKPPAAVKSGGGGKGAVDDPTKKLLDNELAAYKAMADQARELLADRNKMLDLYNQQGLLSVKDYYAALNAATQESTAAQAKAIDDQIAALQKFKAAAKKDTDVADTQGKINKLEEEKAKLYRQSGIAAIESSVKQVQAQKAVQDAANEVNAKILELKGNLGEAAAIRFDASNEANIRMFSAEERSDMVAAVAELRNYTIAQAELNKLQQQFSLAQGDLQIAEERISQARERGTMGEIQSLKASGAARKEAIAIMERHLAVFQAIDAAARTPEQAQAIERLKVQLEGLKATADPLADKFNTLFSDAAGSAFGDFISGTKSAKDAFKDFANQVINDIGRMVAKDLAKQLFGGALGGSGEGGGFNIGSFLSGIFGSGKGFADGGFTGGSAANDPVGFVHRNEYVLNEKTTRRLGVSNLDNVNSGGSMGGFTQVVNIQGRPTNETTAQIANQARRVTQKSARLV
jgi:hypothetical protein